MDNLSATLSTQHPDIGPIWRNVLGTYHPNGFVVPSVPKTKIVAAFGRRVSPVVEISAQDPTLEFAAETAVAVKDSAPGLKIPVDRQRLLKRVSIGVVAIALITAGVYWKDRWQAPAAAAGGSLRIESDPAGAEVRVNGAAKGTTPLSLTMPAGSYSLTVQHGSSIKELPVSVTNGAATVHHITWTDTPVAAPAETGSLSIATDPPGSTVAVDGEERGIAPLRATRARCRLRPARPRPCSSAARNPWRPVRSRSPRPCRCRCSRIRG